MNSRFIVLDVSQDYPLKHVKPNVFYRVSFEIEEEKRHGHFFILNGNIYYEFSRYNNYICCSIEKLKRFITKENIKHFLFKRKKEQLETVNDLYIMVMQCEYKREIDWNEYNEAEGDLKSDFSKRYGFDDFKFASRQLNPRSFPGDALITEDRWGSIITLDMISDRRKQYIPDCIKEDICYFANNMLEENLIDVNDVRFLLHAKIKFNVIGTLSKNYQVYIIMINKNGEQLYEESFCLCDCEKNKRFALEEYFKNELFPCKEAEMQKA